MTSGFNPNVGGVTSLGTSLVQICVFRRVTRQRGNRWICLVSRVLRLRRHRDTGRIRAEACRPGDPERDQDRFTRFTGTLAVGPTFVAATVLAMI